MKRRRCRYALVTLLVLTMADGRAGGAERLFEDVTDGAAKVTGPKPPAFVARERRVKLSATALPSRKNRPGERIRLNLFSDTDVSGSLTKLRDFGRRGTVWSGKLDAGGGDFKLARSGSAVAGIVRSHETGKIFELRSDGRGGQRVLEIDPESYLACAGAAIPDGPDGRQPVRRGVRSGGDIYLDTMVVYTPAARTAVGGVDAMAAHILLAVDASNEALENSALQYRLRLVHTEEISYTEGPSGSTDLSRLMVTDDGHMDDVHTLRDAYGADVVSLIVDRTSFAGIGYRPSIIHAGYSDWAFNVVQWDYAVGNYTLMHEVGHNLGGHHTIGDGGAVRDGSTVFDYSFGWRFTGGGGGEYRTVMGYSPGTRIAYFSNPGVTYDGVATGMPVGDPDEAHNALSISNYLDTAIAYRATVVPLAAVDLSVSASSASVSVVEPGASVELLGTVANSGTSSSGVFWADWYLSTDTSVTTNDTLWQPATIDDVAAAGTAETSNTVAWPVVGSFATPGTYYAALLADSGAVVAEMSEANNAGSISTFTVTDPAPFSLSVPHADMLGYWSFEGGAGTDLSGNGHAMTVTGRVAVTWRGLDGDGIEFRQDD